MLRELRALVKAVAPGAVEKISYGMPHYNHHGRLVYFAALKAHIGVYGLVGTLRFSYGEPLPVPALRAALKARVQQNEATALHQGSDKGIGDKSSRGR
jgi:uncharacterized protein YdhG (YjbR/CyaY superfamily)